MSKFVKNLLTRELQSRYAGIQSALWVDLTGADGITSNAFRRELRARKMQAEIVKNSVFRRACAQGPLSSLADALSGPAMLLTGGDSLIDVAKVVEEWLPKIPALKLRGAVLEGEYLDERAVAGLSRMPSKRDLQARLAGLVLAPGGRLAAAIVAPGGRIAGCIKALVERLEKAAPPGDAPSVPPTAATADPQTEAS